MKKIKPNEWFFASLILVSSMITTILIIILNFKTK